MCCYDTRVLCVYFIYIGYGGCLSIVHDCNKKNGSRTSTSPTFGLDSNLAGNVYKSFLVQDIEVFKLEIAQ